MKAKLIWIALFFCLLSSSRAHAQCSLSSYLGFQIPIVGTQANWGPCINGDLTLIDSILGGTATLTPASTTPSVVGFTNWLTANTGAVTITNFTGGFAGQQIRIVCGASDTFTAIVSDSTIALVSNWSCLTHKSLTLVLLGTVWTETARSLLAAQQTAFLTSTYTNATTTFSNITGLSFPVAANTNYKIRCDLDYQTSASTADVKIQWTGPASPTAITYDLDIQATGTTPNAVVATAFSTSLSETTTPTTATNLPLDLTMTLINGATAGTVQLQAAATGVGTITIIPGSCSLQQ